LCACSDGGDCTSCYQTYPTCVTCIDDAVTTCCPSEYPAYTKCLDDSQKAALAVRHRVPERVLPVAGRLAPDVPRDAGVQDGECEMHRHV